MTGKVEVKVQCADVIDVKCDALVLKYAQGFHGADHAVAGQLKQPVPLMSPRPGLGSVLSSSGRLAARQVLFVGMPPLRHFDYKQIDEFILLAFQLLADELPDVRHIAMTVHGVNFGLDESEAFRTQLNGIAKALRSNKQPQLLETITIVEMNKRRSERLQLMLEQHELGRVESNGAPSVQTPAVASPTSATVAVISSDDKPHVFVAMPFSDEMDDVFIFGIEGPVHNAGLLCERVDMAHFTGDILERIKSRIASAQLVIADLTGANANVYLEVGYAWGKQRPTLLIMREGEQLKFDVMGQRCIFYKTIKDLKAKMEKELALVQK